MAILFISNICHAQTIIIHPNTVISHSKTYNNAVLDMTNGSFIVTNNATLTLNNSVVTGHISNNNPTLITVDKGSLSINNTQMNVKAIGIQPHATTQSLHYVIQMAAGNLTLTNNKFQIDEAFTVGFLMTSPSIPTTGFKIINNKFEKFHGVLYLISTDNAQVSGNTLTRNSYGNIVMIGSNSTIIGNTIYFSGSNRLGDGIDVIDSNDIIIRKNFIYTPTCRGIYLFNSRNITVDQNKIFGGITYAMNIVSFPETVTSDNQIAEIIKNHPMKNLTSANITITNNFMSQNRYGIAANDTDQLTVNNNIFIQRFDDNDARKFWTDNSVLLKNITNLIWTNNIYKEAYTQEDGGDNSKSEQFVIFPQTGGVSL